MKYSASKGEFGLERIHQAIFLYKNLPMRQKYIVTGRFFIDNLA
jgi:hypothetical protein